MTACLASSALGRCHPTTTHRVLPAPMVAIKYQILIFIAIFAGTTISVFTSIRILRGSIFDGMGELRKDLRR